MATTFRGVLNEMLQDPEFKKEWDALHAIECSEGATEETDSRERL